MRKRSVTALPTRLESASSSEEGRVSLNSADGLGHGNVDGLSLQPILELKFLRCKQPHPQHHCALRNNQHRHFSLRDWAIKNFVGAQIFM